jgi:hypothetical protein
MQVFGPNFIQTFMMPYMIGTVLNQAKIENNPLVQKIFMIENPLDVQEFGQLVTSEDYFIDSGTLFDHGGVEHRKIFWKEFTGFIKDQQRISENNVEKFAFRTLPDAKTGVFSQLARTNILKFCTHMVKAVETAEIKRLIDAGELNGEISKEAAALDRVNLAGGKLILAKGSDGKDVYLSEDEIKDALGDVTKRAELLKKLQIRKDSEGVYIFLINPVGAGDGSTLRAVQAAIWQNQKIHVEKKLAKLGLDARDLQVDDYGVLRGNLRDASGTQTLVEVDLEKPGQRRYRLTMTDNSSGQIWLTDSEMQINFSYENKTMVEVFEAKKMEETRESNDTPTRKPVAVAPTTREQNEGSIAKSMQAARDSRGMMNVPKSKKENDEKQKLNLQLDSATEGNSKITFKQSLKNAKKLKSRGIQFAKKQLEDRRKQPEDNGEEVKTTQQNGDSERDRKAKAKKKKQNQKNPISTFFKWAAVGAGGTTGILGIFSSLT